MQTQIYTPVIKSKTSMQTDEIIQLICKLSELLTFVSDKESLGNDNIDLTIEAEIRMVTGIISSLQQKLTDNIESRTLETSNEVESKNLKVFLLTETPSRGHYTITDILNKKVLFTIEKGHIDNVVSYAIFFGDENAKYVYDSAFEHQNTAIHELVFRLTGERLPLK